MNSNKEMDTDLFLQIRRYVASKAAVKLERVQENTRILHDLGLFGEDAEELMEDFSKIFEVDVSGFDSEKCFGSEMEYNYGWVIYQFLSGKRKLKEIFRGKFIPVFVLDLYIAAKTKKFPNLSTRIAE